MIRAPSMPAVGRKIRFVQNSIQPPYTIINWVLIDPESLWLNQTSARNSKIFHFIARTWEPIGSVLLRLHQTNRKRFSREVLKYTRLKWAYQYPRSRKTQSTVLLNFCSLEDKSSDISELTPSSISATRDSSSCMH